jgi:hypothetical protein
LEVDAVRRILPALAAVLACAACTVPIFDPSASLAARTLDRIPVYRATSPLDVPRDSSDDPRFDLREETLSFLPERITGGVDMTRGFVFKTGDTRSEVWYEWFAGSRVNWLQGNWSFSAGETMPSRVPVSLKDGSYLGFIQFDGEAWVDRMWADIATPALTFSPNEKTIWLPAIIRADVPALTAEPHIVGMSVNALMDTAQDRITALVRVGTQYTEVTAVFDCNGAGSWSSVMGENYPLNTFLGMPGHLNYCHDFKTAFATLGCSFAQSYDSRTEEWTTWAWWSATPDRVQLTAVTHRIDAVLSADAGAADSSYLFSTEDQIGRVYRYDGTGAGEQVAEFALGTLRFIGEANIDGVWRMLFSRCVVDFPAEQLRFELRAIDTADLLTTFGP